MGVPAFFRWLTMRNPKIILSVQEPQPSQSSSNPQIDNFYVDMNGLIHPACNPQQSNVPFPSSFQQQCDNIAKYLDRLINIVRPRRLIYLAIDGVAPRAKMVQQRGRRFRAALEQKNKEKAVNELKDKFSRCGIVLDKLNTQSGKSFDSNVITPGTQFLFQVCQFVRNFVIQRLATHPQWKGLMVFFSDANVPGEGEHKIMEFIRQQRASPDYFPHYRHCIYGADADLLMLGLATHQPYFYVIRQAVVTQKQKRCSQCGKNGHFFFECSNETVGPRAEECMDFQLIQLWLFRQFLVSTFKGIQLKVKFDLQRLIDDFNFLCIFVGNDFIPHLPVLSIREGGVDALVFLYKHLLTTSSDYITKQGQINFQVLDKLLLMLTQCEQELLNDKARRQQNERRRNSGVSGEKSEKSEVQSRLRQFIGREHPSQEQLIVRFKQELKQMSSSTIKVVSQGQVVSSNPKQQYYQSKFKISPADFIPFRATIRAEYLKALQWVCYYYYQGCCSWSWFYPFHYSPFVSDLVSASNFTPEFDFNRPFRPMEQLLAVLPPRSSWALPTVLQPMMKAQSRLGHLFPQSFEIDLVGKKFSWLGQVLIPFIDEKLLLQTIQGYETHLSAYESRRNQEGVTLLLTMLELQEGQTTCLSQGFRGNLNKVEDPLKRGVGIFAFEQGRKFHHSSSLIVDFKLRGEIDDLYMERTDIRGFNGERTVNLVRRALGLKENFGFHSRSEWNQFHDDTSRARERERGRGGKRERSRQYRQ